MYVYIKICRQVVNITLLPSLSSILPRALHFLYGLNVIWNWSCLLSFIVCKGVCMCVFLSVCGCAYVCVCMCTCLCVYVHFYVCLPVCVCARLCVVETDSASWLLSSVLREEPSTAAPRGSQNTTSEKQTKQRLFCLSASETIRSWDTRVLPLLCCSWAKQKRHNKLFWGRPRAPCTEHKQINERVAVLWVFLKEASEKNRIERMRKNRRRKSGKEKVGELWSCIPSVGFL